MFVDDIRAILNLDSGLDCKMNQFRQHARMFKKCSGAISEWTEKADRGTENREEAWNLFYNYCRIALGLAVSRGKGMCEMENAQLLTNGFLSVLFPGMDYVDEINARLDYIAKRAFDAAWNRNADPFSPMDGVDSFRQMLCCHLEQCAEAKRVPGKKSYWSDAVVSMETQLLRIAFDQSRYRPAQKEYEYFESLHGTVLGVFREICRNTAEAVQPQFKSSFVWESRAALKQHIQLTGADSSARRMTPTWEKVCSLKDAVRKPEELPEKRQEKQPSQRNLPQRNRD
jgi:hypothetical protein